MNLYILIDSDDFIEVAVRGDRTYYVGGGTLPPALVVCQNGLKLPQIQGKIADVTIGTDTAYAEFCTHQRWVGHLRTKVTIRTLARSTGNVTTLTDELHR